MSAASLIRTNSDMRVQVSIVKVKPLRHHRTKLRKSVSGWRVALLIILEALMSNNGASQPCARHTNVDKRRNLAKSVTVECRSPVVRCLVPQNKVANRTSKFLKENLGE